MTKQEFDYCTKCGSRVKAGQKLCWLCKNEQNKESTGERVRDASGACFPQCDYIASNLRCPAGAPCALGGKNYCREHWKLLYYKTGGALDGELIIQKLWEKDINNGNALRGYCVMCGAAISKKDNAKYWTETQNMNCPRCGKNLVLNPPDQPLVQKKSEAKVVIDF